MLKQLFLKVDQDWNALSPMDRMIIRCGAIAFNTICFLIVLAMFLEHAH